MESQHVSTFPNGHENVDLGIGDNYARHMEHSSLSFKDSPKVNASCQYDPVSIHISRKISAAIKDKSQLDFERLGKNVCDLVHNFLTPSESLNMSTAIDPHQEKSFGAPSRHCMLFLYQCKHLYPKTLCVSPRLEDFSSREISFDDICKNGRIECPLENSTSYPFHLEKYFKVNKLNMIGTIYINIEDLQCNLQDLFSSTTDGMLSIKDYLSSVRNLLIVFKLEICFNFLLKESSRYEAIMNILNDFKYLKMDDFGCWNTFDIAARLLNKNFELNIDLKEVLVSVGIFWSFYQFNFLKNEKKAKIVLFFEASDTVKWDNYIFLESPYRSVVLHERDDYAGKYFDFSWNQQIENIELHFDGTRSSFWLPGEIKSNENLSGNASENVFSSPHPLRKIRLIGWNSWNFNLKRVSSSLFGNLIELKLNFNSFFGELKGKHLESLRVLALTNLSVAAIIDFSDVETPLQLLQLKDCHGTILMKMRPAELYIEGLFHVNDQHTFFSKVEKLRISIANESELIQYPYLFGTDESRPEHHLFHCLGRGIRSLKLEPRFLEKTSVYFYENKILDDLCIDPNGPNYFFVGNKAKFIISGDLLSNLKHLQIANGTTMLLSTFPWLRFLRLSTEMVGSDWTISTRYLSKLTWAVTGGSKFMLLALSKNETSHCLEGNVIRGFSNENEYFQAKSIKKILKSASLKEFTYRSEYLRTEFLKDIISSADLDSLTIELDYHAWHSLQNLTWTCANAKLYFQGHNHNSWRKPIPIPTVPYTPNVVNLELKCDDEIILDGEMKNLEMLSIHGIVRFGNHLKCPKIHFVEAPWGCPLPQVEYCLERLKSQNFGTRDKWFYCGYHYIAFKISPERDQPAKSPESKTKISPTECGEKLETNVTLVSTDSTASIPTSSLDAVVSNDDISIKLHKFPNRTQLTDFSISSRSTVRSNWCSCCFSTP